MSEVRVECYSGYRADERPLRFTLGSQSLEIISIDGQWYSPDATFFRVHASDGNTYVLRHSLEQGLWTLEAIRTGGRARD
jgi:hypothetical protein